MSGEWIPVSKGMPDNGKNVLVFVAVPGRRGGTITVANHIDDRTEEASDEALGYADEWAVYDEDTDTYWCPEGWYERQVANDAYGLMLLTDPVVAWMPLPAKPENYCHAGRDGECEWHDCPQLRDGEPARSGRHCPLDDNEVEVERAW